MPKLLFNPEIVKAIYMIDGETFKPKYQLRRFNTEVGRGNRYYFRFKGGKPVWYISVTSFIQEVMPTPYHLIEWYMQHGVEGVERILKVSATYGTMMHEVATDLVLDGKLEVDKLLNFATQEGNRIKLLDKEISVWKENIVSDMIAFNAFLQDSDLRLVAAEYPIADDKLRLAGTMDFVADIRKEVTGFFGEVYKRATPTAKAGDPKKSKGYVRVNAYIDLKSSRKGFHDTQIIQGMLYQKMWNTKFGKLFHIDEIYNWSPKDWRSENTNYYNFTQQDDKISWDKINTLLKFIKIDDLSTPSMTIKTLDSDIIAYKETNYSVKTIREHALEIYQSQYGWRSRPNSKLPSDSGLDG